MTTLILPTNPTRAYISLPHCRRRSDCARFVHHPEGVMIARVQYVGSLLEHTFEIEASRIFTEVIKDGYRAEVTTWDEQGNPIVNAASMYTVGSDATSRLPSRHDSLRGDCIHPKPALVLRETSFSTSCGPQKETCLASSGADTKETIELRIQYLVNFIKNAAIPARPFRRYSTT